MYFIIGEIDKKNQKIKLLNCQIYAHSMRINTL